MYCNSPALSEIDLLHLPLHFSPITSEYLIAAYLHSCMYCTHFISSLSQIINVATRRVPWAESTVISNYKEVSMLNICHAVLIIHVAAMYRDAYVLVAL